MQRLASVEDAHELVTFDGHLAVAYEGPNLGGITKGIPVWKPIIAVINRYCLVGGMELAMACDIRIAADHQAFDFVESPLQ